MQISAQMIANQSVTVTKSEETLNTPSNAVSKNPVSSAETVVNLAIQNLLKELAVMIGQRQNLVDSLPEAIQQLVQNTLDSSNEQNIAQGFAAVLKCQRTSVDKILTLAATLENAAQITDTQQAGLDKLPAEIKQMLANIKTLMPTQSELMTLAKEVSAATHTEVLANPLFKLATTADSPQSLLKGLIQIIADKPQLLSSPQLAVKTAVSGMPAELSANGQMPSALPEGMPAVNSAENSGPAGPESLTKEQPIGANNTTQATASSKITPETRANLQEVIKLLNTSDSVFLKDVSPEIRQQIKVLVEMMQGQVNNLTGEKTIQPKNIQQRSDLFISDDADGAVHTLKQLVDIAKDDKTVLRPVMNAVVPFAPMFVQQGAAEGFQLPDIWSILTLAHAISAEDKQGLEKSSSTLKELAASLQKGIQASPANGNEHVSTAVSIPLYFAEGAPPYPLYMHVYHQRKGSDGSSDENANYETWLRLCLVTQNMGTVECVFRLYEQNLLDLRVIIEDQDGAMSFKQDLSELREKFDQWPLKLTGISVG